MISESKPSKRSAKKSFYGKNIELKEGEDIEEFENNNEEEAGSPGARTIRFCPSIESRANWLSRATFFFTHKLMRKGYQL
jgi:hypothetical protein